MADEVDQAPEAAPVEGNSGGGNIMQQMMDRGWTPDSPDMPTESEDGDVSSAAEPATPEAAAAGEPKPKVVDAKDPRFLQLEELAKELGLEVEGKRVAAQEVVEFRQHQAKERRALRAMQDKARTEIERMRGEAEKEFEIDKELRTMRESGDLEGIVKKLGFDDWNALQKAYMTQLQDPNWQRIRALEEREEQRQKETEAATKQAKAKEEQTKKEQAKANIIRDNRDLMAGSEDPILKHLADHPLLAETIYSIQHQEWDGKTYPDPVEALDMRIEGANSTVREELQDMYERLARAFGKDISAEAEANAQQTPAVKGEMRPAKRPAPKTTNQRKPPVEASTSTPPKTEQEWKAYSQRKLAEAALRDMQS